ncbi:hypothetical protein LPJ78_005378, partial [Coemansia sp. RSA 989]
MTSYSFSTASAALMGAGLDSSNNGSSGAGNTGYENPHSTYGRESMLRTDRHHGTSPSHYHQAPGPMQTESHAITEKGVGAFSGMDSQGSTALADYFLKQQNMLQGSQDERNDAGREQPADISRMVAAVAAATTTATSSLAQHTYGPEKSRPSATADNTNTAADLPGSAEGATGLVDPLPEFLSSLPMAGQMEAKYAMAPTHADGHDAGSDSTRRDTPSGGLLAAAAAAAASAVGTGSAAGALDHTLGYGHAAYGSTQALQNDSAYTVDGLSFTHTAESSTVTLAPSLSEQSAGGAPDLTAYSISALSRPLNQNASTAAVLLGDSSGTYGASDSNGTGLAGPLGSTNNVGGMLSPHVPPQTPQQYYNQQQAPRSYSDYSTYYRSPPTTLGTNVGASVASSNGGSTQISAAAAAAAAAAMGPAYYTPAAYQQYMRTGAGPYSYYYSQASSRYLPYAAYPPVRHFVSPARPFKCETCEQSFSRNHDLKRHVKIHSGIKPHKCPKCGKSFGRSDALKRHSMVKRCRSATTSS